MKIVAISDTHNFMHEFEVPDGDVLIHAGDALGVGNIHELRNFFKVFKKLPHKHKIYVAGNHDRVLEEDREVALNEIPDNITYLQDESVTIDGVKIYGTPWQPAFCDWAFNITRNSTSLLEKWNSIPNDTDILVTHCPPFGILDYVNNFPQGCEMLLPRVKQVKPKYHIFGHIHEGYGIVKKEDIVFINASICNAYYDAINKPHVFKY